MPEARQAHMRRTQQDVKPPLRSTMATMPDRPPPARPSPSVPVSGRSRPQLGPADWIQAALSFLVAHPVDAVRVDVLARHMGVTRGSFYWHFTDRDDLLQRLLQSWRNTTTEQVIARFQGHGRDPAGVLRELLHLPAHGRKAAQASSVELAIREWARRDAGARQVLEEVDSQRLNYIGECFRALGHPPDEARHRAFVLYGCIVSDSLLASGGAEPGVAQRQARLAFAHGLLVPAQGAV
jgi:AcrR family transcriptional regulator